MMRYDMTQGVAPGEPVLHRYSFSDKLWYCQKVPGPACGHGSLLAAHGKSLIVYGKLLAISSLSARPDLQSPARLVELV